MSDRHEKPGGATPPFCIDKEVHSSAILSSIRKRLASSLPLLLIGALLSIGAGRLPVVRGAVHPAAHVSLASALTNDAPLTRPQVIARAQPAVVEIIAANCQNQARRLGSGEIIDRRGYIVTNYHVVVDLQKYHVQLFDNSLLPAQLTGVDPADDLAVLKINTSKHLPIIAIGNSSRLQVGESVLAIGHPISNLINETSPIGKIDGATITDGIISALGRVRPVPVEGVKSEIIDAIQSDAELNPGNSGGALVNMQAQLVGIPEQRINYSFSSSSSLPLPIKGIGFSIPSNRVMFVVAQLIQYGRIVQSGRATMNATFVSVTPALAALDSLAVDHGAYISDVTNGGSAALAGLRTGDVIVQVNNTPIMNAMDVTDALMPIDAGTTASLGVVRGTQQMQVRIKLQALPVSVKTMPVQQCPSTGVPVVGKG